MFSETRRRSLREGNHRRSKLLLGIFSLDSRGEEIAQVSGGRRGLDCQRQNSHRSLELIKVQLANGAAFADVRFERACLVLRQRAKRAECGLFLAFLCYDFVLQNDAL